MLTKRILVMVPTVGTNHLALRTPRQRSIFDEFESHCRARAINPEVCPLGLDEDPCKAIAEKGSCNGLFIMPVSFLQDRFKGKLGPMSRLVPSITILDESSVILPDFVGAPFSCPVGILQVLARQAGATAARHLAKSKHRQAVYFSHAPGSTWSKERLLGFVQEFGKLGGETIVQDLVAATEDSHSPDGGYGQEIMRLVRSLGDTVDSKRIATDLFNIQAREDARLNLQPDFEAALKHSSRAWICDSDVSSHAASGFLKKRNIAVPESISLVGIDDTPELSEAGIDTVSLDIAALVDRALHFMMQKATDPPPPEGIVLHDPGELILRGSVSELQPH